MDRTHAMGLVSYQPQKEARPRSLRLLSLALLEQTVCPEQLESSPRQHRLPAGVAASFSRCRHGENQANFPRQKITRGAGQVQAWLNQHKQIRAVPVAR